MQRCSRLIGLPASGLVLALAKTPGLSGIPAAALAQGSDSLNYPLLGFGPPTRYVPQSRPLVSPPRAPLLGFLAPSAHWGEGVHVPAGYPAQPPGFCPGIRQQVPSCQLRCRPQVFATSRRLLPPSAGPPFSGRWRSWGFPFRGSFLARSPGSSSLPACPPDVSPAGRASPVLGGGASRRERRYLGWPDVTPLFVFRASVHARVGLHHRATFSNQ